MVASLLNVTTLGGTAGEMLTIVTTPPDPSVVVGADRSIRRRTLLVGFVATLGVSGDSAGFGATTAILNEKLQMSSFESTFIVSAYTLAAAATLMVGGSLSDRYGHRRLIGVGTNQECERHSDAGSGDHQHSDVGGGRPDETEHDRTTSAGDERPLHAVPVAQDARSQDRGGQGQSRQRRNENGRAGRELQAASDERDVGRQDPQNTHRDGAAQAHGHRRHDGREPGDLLLLPHQAMLDRRTSHPTAISRSRELPAGREPGTGRTNDCPTSPSPALRSAQERRSPCSTVSL